MYWHKGISIDVSVDVIANSNCLRNGKQSTRYINMLRGFVSRNSSIKNTFPSDFVQNFWAGCWIFHVQPQCDVSQWNRILRKSCKQRLVWANRNYSCFCPIVLHHKLTSRVGVHNINFQHDGRRAHCMGARHTRVTTVLDTKRVTRKTRNVRFTQGCSDRTEYNGRSNLDPWEHENQHGLPPK